MSDKHSFEYLVSTLTFDERDELLDKIRKSYSHPADLPEERDDLPQVVDTEDEYNNAGLLIRLIIFLKSVFTGRNRVEVFEEHLIQRFTLKLVRDYPGLINPSDGLILHPVYDALETMEKTSVVFSSALSTALGSHFRQFTAYLVELEFPILHDKLSELISVETISAQAQNTEDEELKRKMEFELENIFMDISEDEKNTIAVRVRELHQLRQISDFPFHSVLRNFIIEDQDGNKSCKGDSIRDNLVILASLIPFIRHLPSPAALESLFLFMYSREQHESKKELHEKMDRQFKRIENIFKGLHGAVKRVPFILLARYVTENINFVPPVIKVPEEWLTSFKNYWEDRLSSQYRRYIDEKKRSKTLHQARMFLDVVNFPVLPHYKKGAVSAHVSFTNASTAAFLYTFVEKIILREYKPVLQVILIDGEFYKEQNREDFNDSYNFLLSFPERVMKIDEALEESGSVGVSIVTAEKEAGTEALRAKRIAAVTAPMEDEMGKLLGQCVVKLDTLQDVLNGILRGEVGGRFDTLANLAYLGGKNKKGFKSRMDTLISTINEGLQIAEILSTW